MKKWYLNETVGMERPEEYEARPTNPSLSDPPWLLSRGGIEIVGMPWEVHDNPQEATAAAIARLRKQQEAIEAQISKLQGGPDNAPALGGDR